MNYKLINKISDEEQVMEKSLQEELGYAEAEAYNWICKMENKAIELDKQ